MSRPYRRHSAIELEAIFESYRIAHPAKLHELREELLQRSTQKAEDLLLKVNEALAQKPQEAPVQKAPPKQMDLGLPPAASPPTKKALPLARQPEALSPSPAPSKIAGERKFKSDVLLVRGQMTATDAAKVLGVSANANWEVIEKVRRELVLKSVTSTNTIETSLASRVNLAYLSLAMSRHF